MLDFLIRHQTDVMLLLGAICAMTAFFVFLTDSLGKDRKVALMILEIGGMILAIFEMFSYMYRGDMSELGYWMVRVGNFMTFAMMPCDDADPHGRTYILYSRYSEERRRIKKDSQTLEIGLCSCRYR